MSERTEHINDTIMRMVMRGEVAKARAVAATLPSSNDRLLARVMIANAELEVGAYDDAVSDARAVRESDCQHPRILCQSYIVEGIALQSLGMLSSARGAYLTALAISESPEIHFHLSDVTDDSSGKEQHLRRAIELDPDYDEALVSLASVASSRGDSEEAESHLVRALHVDPNYMVARLDLARLRFRSALSREAAHQLLREVDSVLHDGADDQERYAWTLRALSLYSLGRMEDAIVAYEAAHQIDPDDPHTLLWWGHALVRTWQPERAIEVLRRGVALDPMRWRFYRALAWAYEDCGNQVRSEQLHVLADTLAR